MDRLIYTAMTGARHVMEQQATVSNNLANATTNGFRAQLDSFRAVPVRSDGLPTRALVVDSMVNMISLARQFDMQMSLLKNAENNAAKATQILALG